MNYTEKHGDPEVISFAKYRPSLSEAVVTILIGLVFTFQSQIALKSMVVFIGALLVLLGVIYIATQWNMKRKNPQVKFFPPYNGYVSIIFGVILILFPVFFISIFMFLLGIMLLVLGVTQIYLINKSRRAGLIINGYFFVIPAIVAFLGLFIMVNPFTFVNVTVIILFGVSSLVYGVANIIRYFVIKNQESNARKNI